MFDILVADSLAPEGLDILKSQADVKLTVKEKWAPGELASVTAINPFLEATPAQWGRLKLNMGEVQHAFDRVDGLTFGAASAIADRVPFDMAGGLRWNSSERSARAFRTIRFGHVVGLHRFGQMVASQARRLEGLPVTVFVSEDPVASPEAARRVARVMGATVEELPSKSHNLLEERARFHILKKVNQLFERLSRDRTP